MSSSQESPRLIVSSCDDRYLWPWACSVYSAVHSADVPVRFLLANVNNLLSPAAQKVATDFFAFLNQDGRIFDLSLDVGTAEKYQWNATIYARLGSMDVLNERFLWLDSDTILSYNWTNIFSEAEAQLEDPHVVACGVQDRPATLDWMRASGTNAAYQATNETYVNAGVIFVDPLRWRQGGMDHTWMDLAATPSEKGFQFPDQDILNYLLAGKVGLLPASFNHIVSAPTNGEESILHFAGFPKPWRLTEPGRALFVAIQAARFEQSPDVSGGGWAWESFPKYWQVERGVMSSLHDNGWPELAKELSRYRAAQLTPLSVRERIKLGAIRTMSKPLLRRS